MAIGSTRILVALGLTGAACLTRLEAQPLARFTLNVGGGFTTPLNPSGAYTAVSGNFLMGAGYNIGKSNAVMGEFLWSGLPSNVAPVGPAKAPYSGIDLYSLTANYRHQFDRLGGSPFGMYFVGGGGWYQRFITIQKDYTLPAGVPCAPNWYWYGYGCADGYVYTDTLGAKGISAGGLNTGVGFTVRLADSNLRFFMEARYHYAFSQHIPTTVVPVTFGIRYN